MTFSLSAMAIRLQTPRNIINSHAVLSSLLEEIVIEVSGSQLKLFSTFDAQNLLSTVSVVSFAQESATIVSLVFAALLSYQYVRNSKLMKLQSIQDYTKVKKTVRNTIFIFVCLFLRNVENAI